MCRLGELPEHRVAVVVNNGIHRRSVMYPTNLSDGTSVLMLGPYDRVDHVAGREWRRKTCQKKDASAALRKAMDEWSDRVNLVYSFLWEDEERTCFFLVAVVYAKGFIPEGEEPFPKEYMDIPVHVVEGRLNEFE
jgi:hypothetical protein